MELHSYSKSTATRFRSLTLAAALLMFLLIVNGGVVRATGAGNACPDWPTCLGSPLPPQAPPALLNYSHRALAFLAFSLTALLAWKGDSLPAAGRRLIRTAWGSLLLQIPLGALFSLKGFNSLVGSGALHLGLSLFALAMLVAATVLAFIPTPSLFPLRLRSPFARLSLLTFLSLSLLLVSGTIVSSSGASSACTGWPLCAGGLPTTGAGWLAFGHRLIVAITALLMIALLRQAWRTQRTQTAVLTAAVAAGSLFFAQALLGAQMMQGLPPHLLALHQATAVAAWVALLIESILVGYAGRSAQDEQAESAAFAKRQWRIMARDLLLLTKPIVVLLLLVTTYAGMVIGAQAWPALPVTFWTLLGGFMAAGGSGAINQYIDRFDDEKMQRTQKRPIPSGRLTPGEGLAFGVLLTLASFYLMVAFVNLLAALLTLAGIIYYVLIYSIFLKKTTVQNIVIGGGAGAIPPLVGWAAATGSLNIPSLFLFAIVFMWTPPHFWALALVRRNDYARASVPMLPVVRGEGETRWQIFIYTLELVGLTLLLPIFGLGGGIYLIGAAALGGWLISAAWKVWKLGGNKLAWKMYRYSSMYLAFLFVVLMIDRLL